VVSKLLSKPHYLFQLAAEVLLNLTSPWTFLLNRFFAPFLASPSVVQQRPDVVIVVTWLHKSPLHWFWKWYLDRKGFRTAIAYFSLRTMSIEESAGSLKRYFDANHLVNTSIVGISTGGLTSLLFLERLDGWSRVPCFITIGTPFRGSWAAIALFSSKNARALLPNSAFISRISKLAPGYPERMTCLSAFFDEYVPRSSSCLPGVDRVVVDVAGHDYLHSLSKSTYDDVIRLLTDKKREGRPTERPSAVVVEKGTSPGNP